MGKKKSAVLIVLMSVVLAALLFISVTPSFYVNTTQRFTSLLSIVDLGSDLGGGYSVVYYPEGVITKEEYERKKRDAAASGTSLWILSAAAAFSAVTSPVSVLIIYIAPGFPFFLPVFLRMIVISIMIIGMRGFLRFLLILLNIFIVHRIHFLNIALFRSNSKGGAA